MTAASLAVLRPARTSGLDARMTACHHPERVVVEMATGATCLPNWIDAVGVLNVETCANIELASNVSLAGDHGASPRPSATTTFQDHERARRRFMFRRINFPYSWKRRPRKTLRAAPREVALTIAEALEYPENPRPVTCGGMSDSGCAAGSWADV